MSASEVGRILELVLDMDIDVNMYLCGELARSALFHRILEACRQIRRRPIDGTAERQLEHLECAAGGISSLPSIECTPKRPQLPGLDESQVIKGLCALRAQVQKTHSSMH